MILIQKYMLEIVLFIDKYNCILFTNIQRCFINKINVSGQIDLLNWYARIKVDFAENQHVWNTYCTCDLCLIY